ncbi:MAG: tetratricopeptide repeat protein [Pseudomonadales bacterium]
MVEKISDWSESEARTIREQLSRLLASSLFMHAERLGRFLKFVVDETLAGRADRLNQYAIAIDVFDRDETFDPTVDAIVRVEAGRLRSKLLEYYDDLGSDDSIRIELPKRSYKATFRRPSASVASSAVDTDAERESFPRVDSNKTSKLTEPTIAVLPFVNMSPDPEQEYFADGVTEDLITDLSMLPGISVISRQSTFAYKGVAVTVQQVCEELGANLVLEGSVRKVGNMVRITAQLIEGSNGQHLWAQRYDRDVGNIFAIQDEVNQKIVAACSLQLTDSERKRLVRRGTDVIDAYDYVLRGMKETQSNTMEGSARARYCFDSALELDPDYGAAYARLAINYVFRWIQGWSKSAKDSIDKGLELALKAVSVDDQLPLAHAALCWAYVWQGEHDKAIAAGRRAIELDPDDVVALERLALCMNWAGQAESGLPLIDKAKRLNPNRSYAFPRGVAMFMLANYDEAIKMLQSSFELNPNFVPSGLYLAASHALAGNEREAQATVTAIKRLRPNDRLAKGSRPQFKNPEDRERFFGGLRQAGLS